MRKRERRRDLSYRAAARAQREHLRVVHPEGVLDCICERSVLYFRKRKSLGCSCHTKKHGQPKRGSGSCYGWTGFRPAVRLRIAWRAEQFRWMHWRGDATDAFDRGDE